MPLDPAVAARLAAAQDGPPPVRAQHDGVAAAREDMASSAPAPRGRAAEVEVVEVRLAQRPARAYLPPGGSAGAGPVLVHVHGGGFTKGSADAYDALSRALALDVGTAVVVPRQRRAPEDPYPAAHDDVEAAVRALLDGERALAGAGVDVDPGRVALSGDSSGGLLAVAVARRLERRPAAARLAGVAALNAIADPAGDLPSRQLFASGYGLDGSEEQFFRDAYLPAAVDRRDGDVSPARADDLGRLPPLLVAVCGFDLYRDDGLALAAGAQAGGAEVELLRLDGLVHGFALAAVTPDGTDAERAALHHVTSWLRRREEGSAPEPL